MWVVYQSYSFSWLNKQYHVLVFPWHFPLQKILQNLTIENFRSGRARSICLKFHLREQKMPGCLKDCERYGTCDNKQLLDEVFVIPRIIEVEVGVISRSRECPWHDYCIICSYDVTGADLENLLYGFGQSEKR